MKQKDDKSPVDVIKTPEPVNKYSREELLANVEALFGVKKEVLLAALQGDERTEFSIDEARALIKAFMKRRVI